VRLDGAMAADASAWSLAIFLLRFVTTITSHRRVGAGQLEIGARMIEGFAIKWNDIEVSTLMIGMAMLAIARHRIAVTAMKTPRLRPIRGDFLVAF
jgi:hypothetical protein